MQIVIVGAGGHGRVALEVAREEARYHVAGFTDTDPHKLGTCVAGVPVVGSLEDLPEIKEGGVAGAFVAIGDNAVRLSVSRKVQGLGFELVSLVHPRASIATTASVARHVLVCAGSIVCAGASVEEGAIVNSGAIVEHDCRVGTYCHIAPGVRLAGGVRVGAAAFVGIGATVIQYLQIGAEAIVGAGAVVLEDVPAGVTVVGVPARKLGTKAEPSPGT